MSNENAGNPDVLNFPRDTTLKETNLLFRELIQVQKKANNLDVLSLLDGTAATYYKVMKKWFDDHIGWPISLTALTELWYKESRAAWHGYTDFLYTGASAGTKGGDNANLTCTPSTNDTANTDDYAGLPLFAPIDCNWTINPDTLEPVITAIKGIAGNYENTNVERFVGVLQQSAWVYQVEGAESWRFGYSSELVTGVGAEPLPEAVKVDGSMRQFVLHYKYFDGKVVDGKWQGCAGLVPTAYTISHNTAHTISAATGTGFSGTCYCDVDFLRKMMMIKYASLTLDGILQGCVANNVSAVAAKSETGVKRVLIASPNTNFVVGMTVQVGAGNGRNATGYNISGPDGYVITAVETVTVDSTDYVAVYLDAATAFDVTAAETYITSWHWRTGTCDNVKGNDGSPASPGSGKYPAKLQGLEFMHGTYMALSDTIVNYTSEDGTYYVQMFFANRAANQSTAITAYYKESGVKLVQPVSAGWLYMKHMKLKHGVFMPAEFGGSSSTYYKDPVYVLAATVGVRESLVFGVLRNGTALGGVGYARWDSALGSANWDFAGGPSPNGNRGEWVA